MLVAAQNTSRPAQIAELAIDLCSDPAFHAALPAALVSRRPHCSLVETVRIELLRFDPRLTFFDAVTSPDYREVTREPFTEIESASILLIEGSSGGGLPGACNLRVGRRFYFEAASF